MTAQQTTPPGNHHAQVAYPPAIRFFAHLFSYVFHPLFIPLYVVYFITYIHPSYFTGFGTAQKNWIIIRVAYIIVFLPLVSILLLKGLRFIGSIFLKTQKERIIPYIICGIFFFWNYYVLREQAFIPRILVSFFFGVFISSSAALIANIYHKVSMHAIGVGGLLGIFFIILQSQTMLMSWPLSLALLISGLVCTSRLIISDHTQKEIYTGLLIGLACQFAGVLVTAF